MLSRWIVEERPDATNVNNWHWTEKNADAWSKKKLEELFVNTIIEDPKAGNIVIEEMEKCEGEARANNRKAKLVSAPVPRHQGQPNSHLSIFLADIFLRMGNRFKVERPRQRERHRSEGQSRDL